MEQVKKDYTVGQAVELLSGHMYYVADMVLSLGKMARDDEWEHKNKDWELGVKLEEALDKNLVNMMKAPEEVTFWNYLEVCKMVHYGLTKMYGQNGELDEELHEVMYHAGEISEQMRRAKELLHALGFDSQMDLAMVNVLGAEYIGTKLHN